MKIFFFDHVKTTERINMELRPYDTKSFVGRHRLLFFFGFHIPSPFLSLLALIHIFFPPIKPTCTSITVAMKTYVVIFLKENY